MLGKAPEVVDETCLSEHQHEDAELTIGIQVTEGRWIDFKNIKEMIEDILDTGFRGSIGQMDTETYVKLLKDRVALAVGVPDYEVTIELMETKKYGMRWAA